VLDETHIKLPQKIKTQSEGNFNKTIPSDKDKASKEEKKSEK